MAPLNAAMALPALADVDVELPVDWLARDLDLELLGDVRLVNWAGAVGAPVRQRRLVDLIDLAGGGWKAVGLGPVVLAGLAAGLPGLATGLALGEGGGLALAGARRLVELAAEALVFSLQVAEASLKGLAAGTRDGLHTSIIGGASAATALPQLRSRDQLELDALFKYHSACSVGLERAKMMGRSLSRDIASMTCRVKVLPTVLTPMIAVGLMDSMAATKSRLGACGCAYGFWKSNRSLRLGSSRPLTSNIEIRACASFSDRPSCTIAVPIRPARPMAAEPAPRKRMRWSLSLPPVTFRAAIRPASVTLPVPWMSSL